MIAEISQALHHRNHMMTRDGVEQTDQQLLHNYVRQKDPSALSTLVRRHGPMVWSVCRRVLGNHQDAQDAFQATFLVFVRKAATIHTPAALANWLFGVAYQASRKARATAAKRRSREQPSTQLNETPEAVVETNDELQPLLFQEVNRLPSKFRSVVVLCLLEGKTRKEAALQLGVPDGTVGTWLARGRELLAKRLTRRGITTAELLVASLALSGDAAAAMPPQLALATTQLAVSLSSPQLPRSTPVTQQVYSLTEGVLRQMFLNHLKLGAVCLLLATALTWAVSTWSIHLMATGSSNAWHEQRQAAIQNVPRPQTMMLMDGQVNAVSWNPDGKTLATVLLAKEWHNREVNGVFATTEVIHSTIQLWNAETGTLLRSLPVEKDTRIDSMNYSADGRWVALAVKRLGSNVGDVRLLDAKTWDLVKLFEFNGLLTHVSFSPDSKTLIYGGRGRGTLRWSDPGPRYCHLNFLDLDKMEPTGQIMNELTRENDSGFLLSLAFSADGNTLMTGGDDIEGKITLWERTTGKKKGTLDGHARVIEGKEQFVWKMPLAVSPDGQFLVSGCNKDNRIKRWNLQTGQLQQVLTGNKGHVVSVARSPDGKYLVSSGGVGEGENPMGEVILWDGSSGELISQVPCETTGIPVVGFSPDGAFLSVGTSQPASGKSTSQIKLYRVASLVTRK